MRNVNIRWRWFRRLVNIWIESAKYHPETEQRIGIVNKIMQEGEPKNWDRGVTLIGTMGPIEKNNNWMDICNKIPGKDRKGDDIKCAYCGEVPGPYPISVYDETNKRGLWFCSEQHQGMFMVGGPRLTLEDFISPEDMERNGIHKVPGEPFEHVYHHPAFLVNDCLQAFGIRYGDKSRVLQHPMTPDECCSPLDVACLRLPMDKKFRKVFRVGDGRFMGYLAGISRKGGSGPVDAVEIEPVDPTFTHWHPLTHVKFEA